MHFPRILSSTLGPRPELSQPTAQATRQQPKPSKPKEGPKFGLKRISVFSWKPDFEEVFARMFGRKPSFTPAGQMYLDRD